MLSLDFSFFMTSCASQEFFSNQLFTNNVSPVRATLNLGSEPRCFLLCFLSYFDRCHVLCSQPPDQPREGTKFVVIFVAGKKNRTLNTRPMRGLSVLLFWESATRLKESSLLLLVCNDSIPKYRFLPVLLAVLFTGRQSREGNVEGLTFQQCFNIVHVSQYFFLHQ